MVDANYLGGQFYKVSLMDKYQHIFFDLDRTLWDFDRNSVDALREIIDESRLTEMGVEDPETFIADYQRINEAYWALYREQKVDKETLRWIRFDGALKAHGINNKELACQLADRYIQVSPLKTGLLPGTIDSLDYLAGRYQLHIITNGFEEVQHLKLERSDLARYFQVVVTSEKAGCKKPGKEIFEHACAESGAKLSESMMIGDDLQTDILGARTVGMDHVFFNPHSIEHPVEVTHEIAHLLELKTIL